MKLRCRFRWLLAISIACFTSGAVFADNTDPKYTLNDPDGKDQDFDLQGEFRGTAQLSKFSHGDFGLQVVSMGGGRFQGQLLIGGLPGDGWNGFARIPKQQPPGDKEGIAGAAASTERRKRMTESFSTESLTRDF